MHIPPNFDLRALQVFVVTAEQGGMTQSARALGMTQSGVSQTIAALEEAVGARLFDRSVRPIVLTSSGRSLFERSQKLLADTREAFLEASQAENKKLSTLTIAMPESLANLLGPKLVRNRRDLCGYWRVWAGLTLSHREEFLSHAIDVLITEDSNITDLSGLERHAIFSEPYVLIFPKDFSGSTELGQHLDALPLLRFSLRSSTGRQTETQLSRLRLRFAQTAEFDTSSGLSEAVAERLGWGITTPMCLMQRTDLIGRLKVAPIHRGGFYRHFSLVTRENSLGRAPEEIAGECRAILQRDVLPQLFTHVPWLENMFICRTTRELYKREA